MAKRYYYTDSAGTEHCAHTSSSPEDVVTGAAMREQILDAGDYTGQLKDKDDGLWGKQLSIGPLGSKRT